MTISTTGIVAAAYIVAALLFVLSLAGLSRHETAKNGNTYGMAGMAIALVATDLGGVREPRLAARRADRPHRRTHAGRRRHRRLAGAAGRDDGDAAAHRDAAQLRRPRGGPGRLQHVAHRRGHRGRGFGSRRRAPHRDLPRRLHRGGHPDRFGGRVPQAQRPHPEQPAHAAGPPPDEPRRAGGHRGTAGLVRPHRRRRPAAADDASSRWSSGGTSWRRSAAATCRSSSRCSTATPGGPPRPPASCSATTCSSSPAPSSGPPVPTSATSCARP